MSQEGTPQSVVSITGTLGKVLVLDLSNPDSELTTLARLKRVPKLGSPMRIVANGNNSVTEPQVPGPKNRIPGGHPPTPSVTRQHTPTFIVVTTVTDCLSMIRAR